ncbi:MAG: hypothetical protein WCI22_13720 [Actinomycetota bacterium]
MAGPYWDAVRSLIEEWASRLPPEEQVDTCSRLRSADNRVFTSAYWELYLHAVLVSSGYSVECHPPLAHTSRRPDFLATKADDALYLEATVASKSDETAAADARRARVYDLLNGLDSPNFFLWIDVVSEGLESPSTKSLRRDLATWLSRLNPDAVDQLIADEGFDVVERFEWDCDDWHLVFRPWPKSQASRGSAELRPVGAWGPSEAAIIDSEGPLRRALKEKGKAYGALGLPYVVAVLADDFFTDDDAVLNVLFGTDTVQLVTDDGGRQFALSVRASDGFWYGGSTWLRRNVSGVLVSSGVAPWSVGTAALTLWEHPEPEHPLTDGVAMWRWATALGELVIEEASTRGFEQFGLSEGWPGPHPF